MNATLFFHFHVMQSEIKTTINRIIVSLTVTLVGVRVRLCRCPADAGRRRSHPRADWPSGWS